VKNTFLQWLPKHADQSTVVISAKLANPKGQTLWPARPYGKNSLMLQQANAQATTKVRQCKASHSRHSRYTGVYNLTFKVNTSTEENVGRFAFNEISSDEWNSIFRISGKTVEPREVYSNFADFLPGILFHFIFFPEFPKLSFEWFAFLEI